MDENKIDPNSTEGQSPQLGIFWAAILAFLIVVLLGIVAWSKVLSASNITILESAVEESAVGDAQVQVIGDRRINHETVEAVFNGTQLYFAYLKEVKVDDTKMRAIGRDDADRYTIYQPEAKHLRTGRDGQTLYYIKRSPNKYAQLHDRPEEMLPPLIE